MPSIIAIDLETTGLSPQNDEIIEIGAVRFNERRVEGEWSSLINPQRSIPPFISNLTGIDNDMVRNAPLLREKLPELLDFIGEDPILGHNVGFDIGFLKKGNRGAFPYNEVIDTYELASVLFPTASRYNLGALAQSLGIIVQESHRALDDARTAASIFHKLYDRAMTLPIDLIAEIVRLCEPLENEPWGGEFVFRQILRARSKQPIPPRRVTDTKDSPLYGSNDLGLFPPLEPKEQPVPLDPEEVASLMEFGGPFASHFESFEHRQPQIEMMRAITKAISGNQHLMVEAGTGIGKSFAYLVPAALWSVKNNLRVVISTNTINLQDQLIKKDIPDLRAALGLDLRSTILKGRSNYLCPRRKEIFRQRGPSNAEEMRVLAKILVWLQEGGVGDRSEINLNGPIERDIWGRFSAEDEGCKAEVCLSQFGGACPFHRAHQSAMGSHLIIVNHALLLSDIATGNRILPGYDYLIVDEAHHLEAATTGALSYRVTQSDLSRLMKELGSISSGVLGHTLHLLTSITQPSDQAAFRQEVERITDIAFRLDHNLREFFQAVNDFLLDQREGKEIGPYGQQERIVPSTRTLPIWEGVEIAWGNCEETLKLLLNLLAQFNQGIGQIEDFIPKEVEDSQGTLNNIYRRLNEAQVNISALASNPNYENIYWIEIQSGKGQLSLQAAPLHVGGLMEKFLWHEKASIILTSATLTANSEFDYLRNRLNADEADELMLGSPFDFEESALLYIANDIPEPGDAANYQRAVEKSLIALSKATGGRLLALFTSYTQLKRTSQAISPALAKEDIIVYEQGEGASPNTLLETFRDADKAVLLGTRAFWEGVDIPGVALSVLVIVKLPFDVPTDPIISARSETFENPFNEYSLPEAILRFRQGFGRLIRTQSDRGVVVILDRRILSKKYGRAFIESIPTCTVKVDSINSLPSAAASWLNL